MINKPIGERILTDLIKRGAYITGIITEEEDGKGWWKPTEIRKIAREHNIPVYKTHRTILPLDLYEVALSIQYSKILEEDFINEFEYVLNLHFGELPRYRGMNPSAHAIMNARKDNHWRAGVTLHYIDAGIDTGKLIEVGTTHFNYNTLNADLYNDLEGVAWEVYQQYVDYIINGGNVVGINQRGLIDKDSPSYYYYRNSLSDKLIRNIGDFDRAWDIARGLYFPPFDPAHTIINNEKYYVIPSVALLGNEFGEPDKTIYSSIDDRYLCLYKEIPDWYYAEAD